MQVEIIANLLSRLCALQGRAVPVHRFHFHALSLDYASTGNEDQMIGLLRDIWTTVLPNGEFKIVKVVESKGEFPLVWISKRFLSSSDFENGLLILRGVKSQSYIAENAAGQETERDASSLEDGIFIKISVEKNNENIENSILKKPTTAKEWFVFAIKKRKKRKK